VTTLREEIQKNAERAEAERERRRDRELDGTAQRFAATCEVREVPGAGRKLRFVASTERVGRDGDIIRAKGWDTKTYMKNPVFLWAHDPSQPPIGRVTNVEKVKGDQPRLEAEVEFAGPEEGHEFADTVYRLYRRGFLKAVSVGFLVRSFEKPTDEQRSEMGLGPFGIVITNAELLELSAVPVPADPGALKITKDDRGAELVDDLVRIRSGIADQDPTVWGAAQKAVDNALTSFGGTIEGARCDETGFYLYRDNGYDAYPTSTILTDESMRALLEDFAEEITERISDTVVRSLGDLLPEAVARDTTAPKKPTSQTASHDLYRLRDAIDAHLAKRKESH
jgi:HK97 family phage prohead protease